MVSTESLVASFDASTALRLPLLTFAFTSWPKGAKAKLPEFESRSP